MIAAYVGAPGDCKTYSLVHWLLSEQKSGRRTLSQFAVQGCWPLEYLGDLHHPKNSGVSVGIDEVARILPARDWRAEDDVESAVLEIHRHYGQDIRYCMQDVGQASVSLRRLTEWYIFCYRVGADPSRLLKAGKRPSIWQCPWAVRQVWVHKDDMVDGKPKAPEHRIESKVRYVMWRRSVALAYDTRERLFPGGLQQDIQTHLAMASERLSVQTPWQVVDGTAVGRLTQLYRGRDEKEQRKRNKRVVKRVGDFNGQEGEPGDSEAAW